MVSKRLNMLVVTWLYHIVFFFCLPCFSDQYSDFDGHGMGLGDYWCWGVGDVIGGVDTGWDVGDKLGINIGCK